VCVTTATIGLAGKTPTRALPTTIARQFPVRLSSTRCGVEICKTVECLTEINEIADSTGPDEREHYTEAYRIELARSEHHHGRATAIDCHELDDRLQLHVRPYIQTHVVSAT
jgi:hypothetical protein